MIIRSCLELRSLNEMIFILDFSREMCIQNILHKMSLYSKTFYVFECTNVFVFKDRHLGKGFLCTYNILIKPPYVTYWGVVKEN